MSEAQAKKAEAERDRLQMELKTLTEAISTRQACEECVRRCAGAHNTQGKFFEQCDARN